jgi:hypothetical protein
MKKCKDGKVISPKSGRCVKACKDGQVISPKSGRCVKKCKDGQTISPQSGRCKKKCKDGLTISPKSGRCVKDCTSGKFRNIETGRCVNAPRKKSVRRTKRRSTSKKSVRQTKRRSTSKKSVRRTKTRSASPSPKVQRKRIILIDDDDDEEEDEDDEEDENILPKGGISISQFNKNSKKRSDALKQTNTKALTEPCAIGIYCKRPDCTYAHTIDEFVKTECMKGWQCNKGIGMTGCAFSHDAKKGDICMPKCDHRNICVRHHPHESASSYHDRIKRLFGDLSRPPRYANIELPRFYKQPVRDNEDELIDEVMQPKKNTKYTIFHYISENDINGLKRLLLRAPYDLGDIFTLTDHQRDQMMKAAHACINDPSLPKKWLALFLRGFLSIPQQIQNPFFTLVVPLTGIDKDSGMMVVDKELNLQKELRQVEMLRPRIQKLSDILHRFSDYSKSLNRREINDEWLKCWEMIQSFQLIPQQLSRPFRVCCSTNSFLSSIQHYTRTRTRLQLEFYNMESLKLNKMSIDLYTGDFTRFDEALHGLSILSVNGSFLCKVVHLLTPLTIHILYIVSEMFTDFAVTKPMASRPEDSDLYIIGKGFKGYETCKAHLLILSSYLLSESRNPIPVDFYLRIVFASYLAYTRQINQITNQIEIAKDIKDMRNVRDIRDIRDIRMANEFRNRNALIEGWKQRFPILMK